MGGTSSLAREMSFLVAADMFCSELGFEVITRFRAADGQLPSCERKRPEEHESHRVWISECVEGRPLGRLQDTAIESSG